LDIESDRLPLAVSEERTENDTVIQFDMLGIPTGMARQYLSSFNRPSLGLKPERCYVSLPHPAQRHPDLDGAVHGWRLADCFELHSRHAEQSGNCTDVLFQQLGQLFICIIGLDGSGQCCQQLSVTGMTSHGRGGVARVHSLMQAFAGARD
jgi:hypothetical protein